MKKLVIILALLAISTTSYAVFTSHEIRLPEENSQYIYGWAIDRDSLNVQKFVDGKNTCYMVVNKLNANSGNSVNTTISCVR